MTPAVTATVAIDALRRRAEAIRRAELAAVAGAWERLSDDDRRRVEALTAGIVEGILHEPALRLRAAAARGDAAAYLDSLRHLFGLEREAGADEVLVLRAPGAATARAGGCGQAPSAAAPGRPTYAPRG